MTFKIVCTNPATGGSTEPVTGIATREEADRERGRRQLEENLSDCSKRTGVTLVLSVQEEA